MSIVPSSPRTVSEWCQKDVMCSFCCSAPRFQYFSHLRKAALSSSPEKDKENGTGTQTPVQNLGNNWFNTIVPSSPHTVSSVEFCSLTAKESATHSTREWQCIMVFLLGKPSLRQVPKQNQRKKDIRERAIESWQHKRHIYSKYIYTIQIFETCVQWIARQIYKCLFHRDVRDV